MTKRKKPEDFLASGRPTMYRPEFCQQLLDYFDVEPYIELARSDKKSGHEYTQRVANSLPTLAGFAAKVGVSVQTLHNWGKAHPGFFDATTRAKAIAEDILVTNGLLGLYDARYAIFVAKNYTDLRDVRETHAVEYEVPELPADIERRIAEIGKRIEMLKAQL